MILKILNFWKYIPTFRGKKRLIRFLYRHYISNIRDTLVTSKFGLVFLVPNLIENISFDLLFEGIYEKKIVDFIVNNLPPNAIFIDIGANIGAISLMVAKKRPDVFIYALEASPHIYNYLYENIKYNNLTNVQSWNLAVHNEDNLILDFFAPSDKFGKGSFVSVFDSQSEKIKTIRMDSFFRIHNIQPTLIKVDVEGFEAMIFESMGDFIEKGNRPQIIFEFVDWAEKCSNIFSPGDAQNVLLNKGYQLYILDGSILDKNKQLNEAATNGSYDILAIPFKNN